MIYNTQKITKYSTGLCLYTKSKIQENRSHEDPTKSCEDIQDEIQMI